jgi:phosphoribosylaminoimidazole (AIR) synthetase
MPRRLLIKAIAAITQGGLLGSLTRMLPGQMAARVDLASWRMPPIFQWLRRVGDLPDPDMVRAFNCGLGMVLVIDKLRTVSALKVLRDLGEKPLAIGTLVNRSGGDAVRFSGALAG